MTDRNPLFCYTCQMVVAWCEIEGGNLGTDEFVCPDCHRIMTFRMYENARELLTERGDA